MAGKSTSMRKIKQVLQLSGNGVSNTQIRGSPNSYQLIVSSKISDADAEFGRADTVKEKGFYILPSEFFDNVKRKARSDANLNETLSNVFKNIENSAKGTDKTRDFPIGGTQDSKATGQ